MSSIGGVNGAYSISPFSQTQGVGGGHRGHGPQRLENDLTSFLTEQGVSEDEQSQILSELRSQLASQRSNSTTRPDRTQLVDSVSSVLRSHGVDGDKFAQSIPAPPTRSGSLPPPPPQDGDDDSQDALQQLLDLLAKAWKKALKEKNSSDSSTTSNAAVDTASASFSTNTSSSVTASASQTSDSNSPYQALLELSFGQGELNQVV